MQNKAIQMSPSNSFGRGQNKKSPWVTWVEWSRTHGVDANSAYEHRGWIVILSIAAQKSVKRVKNS